jgi:two-component system OmpR family response regulator
MQQNYPTICYLEDNDTIRENYSELIEDEGFKVIGCKDRATALDIFKHQLIDLAILDIELESDPMGGLILCRKLREQNPLLPILILSSHAHIDYRSRGWRYGADDYVTKDTELDLILVRIKTLIKRYHTLRSHISAQTKRNISSLLEIDDLKHQFSWKGESLELSLTQFWLLKALLENYGVPLSHKALQEAANIYVESNTIVAHIKSIRHQFKKIDPDFNNIKTERGRGYRWI